MRTVKIVNYWPDQQVTKELTVRGRVLMINQNHQGQDKQLQFELCYAEDVEWIIKALVDVVASLKDNVK